MSDDTFIREVNEEIRQERVRVFWSRFGRLVIAFVVVAILATIGYVLWERNRAAQAAADGDRYFAAIDLAMAGDTAGATTAFEDLASDGVGAYPHLARLRLAGALESSGDPACAVAALDAVAASGAPRALRDVAAVRAAYILVDTGTPDDVRERVERLTGEAEPLRHQAREALGLSLWRAGDGEAARGFFDQLTQDANAPAGMPQRARLVLDLIAAGTALPSPDALPPVPSADDSPVPPPAVEPDTPAATDAPADAAPPAQEAEEVLTTPLADQLDLPDAGEPAPTPEATPAPEAAPAEPTPAEPVAPAEPTTPAAPGATPPS